MSYAAANAKVPNTYHFIYGLTDDGRQKPFVMVHYLAIVTCWFVNRPDVINLYYKYEPKGRWWERAKPFLTLRQVHPPDSIFGHPFLRIEHIADVLRLQLLQEHGGIYLDLDILSVRPFSPLHELDCVLGEETGIGLCDAVILAKPGAAFIARWLEGYKTFDPGEWVQHSVQLPWELASQHPEELHLVEGKYFYWPMYWREHLETFFIGPGPNFCQQSICVHLWQSMTWQFIRRLKPIFLLLVDSEFSRLFRPYVEPGTLSDFDSAGVNCGQVGQQPLLCEANWPKPLRNYSDIFGAAASFRAGLSELPGASRSAIALLDILNLSPREAAMHLRCSQDELLSNIDAGREHLREFYRAPPKLNQLVLAHADAGKL